jgi:hypothetical protein
MELPTSKLGQDIGQLARLLVGVMPTVVTKDKSDTKQSLLQTFSRLTKKG